MGLSQAAPVSAYAALRRAETKVATSKSIPVVLTVPEYLAAREAELGMNDEPVSYAGYLVFRGKPIKVADGH